LQGPTHIKCPRHGEVQALDGLDFAPFAHGSEGATRQDGFAIREHCTGATITLVAALLGAGKLKLVPEDLEQRPVGWSKDLLGLAVNV
jgi:hypothetical protein